MAPRSRWLAWLAHPQGRTLVYAVVLALTAWLTCFCRLEEGTLLGDEAAFASTTDRMRATGDWVVPYIGDQPHLNATPLYNWLTLSIAPFCDGCPLWYRLWSAAFGVGCVLLTFILGTLLFRAEVGFLAGLFLALNRDFLFCHGVRFGGMDAMLTFFITAAIACYVWLHNRSGRAGWAWGLLGACIGLAWLSKPPVFGAFFLTGIGLHHMWVRRHEAFAARVQGPLLALSASLAIAVPWYLLLWFRLGNQGLYQLFIFNSVVRALDPHMRDFFCCHRAFWRASISFRLMELALASAVGCWALNDRRQQWGLVLLLAGSFLLSLSAAGRALNYIYYAFPLLCVLLAGLFLECGPRLAARFRPGPGAWMAARIVGASLAVLAVGADAVKTLISLTGPAWVHPPLRVYERIRPQLQQQSCHFIMFDFPLGRRMTSTGRIGLAFEDLYYGPRMAQVDWIDTVEDLKRLLDDRKPAVVVLPPLNSPTPAAAAIFEAGPDEHIDMGTWQDCTYPVLTFHGATTKLQIGDLMQPSRQNGQ